MNQMVAQIRFMRQVVKLALMHSISQRYCQDIAPCEASPITTANR